MRTKKALLILICALAFASGCSHITDAPGAISEWPVKKTWVMMVGVLDYKNSDIYPNMGTRDRRDQTLYDILHKWGVPKKQTIFLKEKDATLANIEKEFDSLLKKTKEGDFLIVFFDGHGLAPRGKAQFAPYDAGDGDGNLWKVTKIFNRIEKDFKGNHILMMSDSCYSGAMGDQMKDLQTEKAYACLTSASGDISSADSWAFTEALVDGFKGNANVDKDGDAKISLDELKDYAFQEMRWFCKQDAYFTVNDKFPKDFKLVETEKSLHEDIGKYFQIQVNGKRRWNRARVVEVKDGSVKFLYYPDGFVGYATLKADSKGIRPAPAKSK